MLVVLMLISLSSLVLGQEVPDDYIEPTQEERTALKSYIAILDSLSGDTMRSLIKLNNSIPALVKECDKEKLSELIVSSNSNVKIRRRVQVVYDALDELAYAVKELHYKSNDIMKLAMDTQSVQLASEVRGLRIALNECETKKKAETAERVKCEDKLPKLQSQLDNVRKERDGCKTNQKQLEDELKKCLEDGVKEKTNLENELRKVRENCNKDNSNCENVKKERDECVAKAEDDKKKHFSELKKCKDDSGISVKRLQDEVDDCKSRDEACNKTKLERDQCQSELDKIKKSFDENVKECTIETGKLKKCEEGKQECQKNCQEAKKKLNKKLKDCNATLDDLHNKLNGTNLEVDVLKSEVERLNASLSMCSGNPANIEMTTEQEPDRNTPLDTTEEPPTTAQLPPANLVPGCEAFEIASTATPVQNSETSFVFGKRQYIVNRHQKYSWQKSRDICSSKGMTLLQLESQEELMQVIPKLRTLFPSVSVQNGKLPFFWMGGHRKGTNIHNPQYEWVCGGTPMKVVNFPSAPRSFNYIQNLGPCVNIYVAPKALGGKWWTNVCEKEFHYVCEKPLP